MSGLKRLTCSQLASHKPNPLDTVAALRVIAEVLSHELDPESEMLSTRLISLESALTL